MNRFRSIVISTKVLLILLTWRSVTYGQDVYAKNDLIDIKHYTFNLTLQDESDVIYGQTYITFDAEPNASTASFDLIQKSGKYGMEIMSVIAGGQNIDFSYSNNKIAIDLDQIADNPKKVQINYTGIPELGLVIDKTKFGQRSFFGDNWPNRARHWLPCVDHPYDKASVTFRITAPSHYDVVATGKKIEESHLNGGMKLTAYYEPTPVAMKVMTIGVTQFASKLLGYVDDIPITAWVYPENRLDGFSDYSPAVEVMEYFTENIGPYPFAKLANMQAKTQWGGLENAGNISYCENSVTGRGTVEGLIAHEIAHQWFGNSVTEDSWNHVWLSEGFATYFTILFQENKYGNEKRKEELSTDRDQVIAYYKSNPSPIVDLSIKDPMKVLSRNTYQKASWVLNMLRHTVGDDNFWRGIRLYYERYRDDNALTSDFQQIMEEVSGLDLGAFFRQWIFTKGYPELNWSWAYHEGRLTVSIDQVQDHHTFKFPLEIGIEQNGHTTIHRVDVTSKSHTFQIDVDKPQQVMLDPDSWLLFEER